MKSLIFILLLSDLLSCKKSQLEADLKGTESPNESGHIYSLRYNPRSDAIDVACVVANCPKNYETSKTIQKVSDMKNENGLVAFLLHNSSGSDIQWSTLRNDKSFQKFQSLIVQQSKLQKFSKSSGGDANDSKRLSAIESQLKMLPNLSKFQNAQSKIERATYTARNWIDRIILAKELRLNSRFEGIGSQGVVPPREFGQFVAKQMGIVK